MKMLLAALVVAVASLCLAGCVLTQPGKPDVTVDLPKPPEYYRTCFKSLTKEPIGTLDREKVVKLIAQLRQSEERKSQCGLALLEWYEIVKGAEAKKGN